MPQIAIFVAKRYAKQAYKHESYNVRVWPGQEMVADALRRAGHEVGYCSSATVREHRIVLVSLTSMADWWPFVRERRGWPAGDYTVIVGGAGVMNIRPFLHYADAFVFGRAEGLIVPLAEALLAGRSFDSPSVAWSKEFSPVRQYVIAQAPACYPHPYQLADGTEHAERAIGCRKRCLFCAYTWHRRHVSSESGRYADATGGMGKLGGKGSEETTIEALLSTPRPKWNHYVTVGLDGTSERLRRLVAKKITREMFQRFLAHVPVYARTYNIVGLPTESDDDAAEFLDDCRQSDARAHGTGKGTVVIHSTPFRAMPATPAAGWPMSTGDHRARGLCERTGQRKPCLLDGARLRVFEEPSTDSLVSVLLDALVLRGTERDADVVDRLAATSAFWSAKSAQRVATMAKHVDVDRLMGECSPDTLPTAYLDGYAGPTRRIMQSVTKRVAAVGEPYDL